MKNGGRGARQKGDRIEREIVKLHKEMGIHAERYPLSGSSRFRGKGHDIDCYVFHPDECPLVGEVKARKKFNVRKWLGTENDLLFLRDDHEKPMVVLPWSVYERIAKVLHARTETSIALENHGEDFVPSYARGGADV